MFGGLWWPTSRCGQFWVNVGQQWIRLNIAIPAARAAASAFNRRLLASLQPDMATHHTAPAQAHCHGHPLSLLTGLIPHNLSKRGTPVSVPTKPKLRACSLRCCRCRFVGFVGFVGAIVQAVLWCVRGCGFGGAGWVAGRSLAARGAVLGRVLGFCHPELHGGGGQCWGRSKVFVFFVAFLMLFS